MRKISGKGYQKHLLHKDLLDQLNPEAPLLCLARRIPWEALEKSLAPYYAERGRPAKSIRLMVGLLILKQLENLSDERVVELWVQNPYFQAFCGERVFQWKFPCDPSDMTYFRKRIGEQGVEQIFKHSVLLHGRASQEAEVIVDTTVQEKNVTFPTDTKLHIKILSQLWAIAKKTKTALYRTHRKEVRAKMRKIRFERSTSAHKKTVQGAKRRLKTIAGKLLRELMRKLPMQAKEQYAEKFSLFSKVLEQKKDSKDKVYSLHEPQVCCIAKGKSHKKYEFGSKAGFVVTKTSTVIVGVQSFSTNVYDGNTLEALLKTTKRMTGVLPEKAFGDRGFRGPKVVLGTQICIPDNGSGQRPTSEKRVARKNFGRRSAIEPVIGHVKSDFRMARCYLKGALGDAINLFMAAAAFNFKKWMRERVYALFARLWPFEGNFRLWTLRRVLA